MSLERFTPKAMMVAHPDDSAADVAASMREGVGAVVIVDGGAPVGIVTDRDLVTRVMADRVSPDVPIRHVMARDPVIARSDESIDAAVLRMEQRGIRRLPIVDDEGRLVGLVALDDLLVLLAAELHRAP